MSGSNNRVECREHGIRDATYLCQHLVSGLGSGFHYGHGDDDPDAVWPDAWCDACETVRQSEGGWNDQSEAFSDPRVLCDGCYQSVRERNWKQDDAAYGELVSDALEYLQARQDRLIAQYGLGSYPRYDWNQDTGQLVFSENGRARVVADIQFVGTISTRSERWLWAWANRALVQSVKQRVRQVRSYGDEHRYLKLASACWTAKPEDGWQMAAITAYLIGAAGAYRSPDDRGLLFLVMTDVHWAQ